MSQSQRFSIPLSLWTHSAPLWPWKDSIPHLSPPWLSVSFSICPSFHLFILLNDSVSCFGFILSLFLFSSKFYVLNLDFGPLFWSKCKFASICGSSDWKFSLCKTSLKLSVFVLHRCPHPFPPLPFHHGPGVHRDPLLLVSCSWQSREFSILIFLGLSAPVGKS